jgi:homoserine dehydrogenase
MHSWKISTRSPSVVVKIRRQVLCGTADIAAYRAAARPDFSLRTITQPSRTRRLIQSCAVLRGIPEIFRVSPRMIGKDHPLVVEGSLNALTLETDMAKEITLIGKGAGSVETASAIIGDILYIRDHYGRRA